MVAELVPDWVEELKSSYEEDAWVLELQKKLEAGKADDKLSKHLGLLRYNGRICVGAGKGWRRKLISEVHNTSLGGHSGVNTTYHRLKAQFYWPHMKEDVHQFIQSCHNCSQNKNEHVKTPGLLQPLEIPDEAWSSISMDFIVGLPNSEGKDTIMVVVDRLTKYAHLLALKHPFTAAHVAKLFIENVYKLHGLPLDIVSDRDTIFTSKFWQELMENLGIKLKMSTAYHPQTDGQTERVNQCIENYLRSMLHNQPKLWTRWLPLAEHWYNTSFHSSLKTSPFKALYGYEPVSLPLGHPVKSSVEAVNTMLKERHVWIQELKKVLVKAQERMKRFADQKRTERVYNVGDWVYLKIQPYRQTSVQGRGNQKLSPKYQGPFEIIQKYGEMAYRLKLPEGSQIHPVFHVSQLKRKVGDAPVLEPTAPLVHPQYEVKTNPEGIIGRRVVKKGNQAAAQILVKWEGQDSENATWEYYDVMEEKFPDFILRDKNEFERRRVSALENQLLENVGDSFDQVQLCEFENSDGRREGRRGNVETGSLREGTQVINGTEGLTGNIKDIILSSGAPVNCLLELNGGSITEAQHGIPWEKDEGPEAVDE